MENKYKKPIEMFVDRAFKKYSGAINEMILFGSVATGHTKNDSDIDILVVTDEDGFKVEKDLIGMAFEVLLKTGEDISVKVISHRDHEDMIKMNTSFIENIISDGVKLGCD